MQKMFKAGILLPLLSLLVLGAASTRSDEYNAAIHSFRGAGQSGVFFEHAYGYALFPTVGKGAFWIGGAYGKGRVYTGGRHVGDTSLTQISIGLQAGGQAFSQIIFFENEQAFRDFSSGNFEFSAQASAVAITAGVSADASTTGGLSAGASGGRNDAVNTHGGYRKGMAVFTIAKGGLMYEAAIAGQKFTFTPL